jgi:hypothetical protein
LAAPQQIERARLPSACTSFYDLVASHGVDGKYFIQNDTYTEKYWFEITDCGKNSLPLREDYN